REDLLKTLRERTGQPAALASGRPLESIVDDRFDKLRTFVRGSSPGKPAPIEGAVAMIGEVYTLLSANKVAIVGKTALPASEVPTKIKAQAALLPEPIRSTLTTLSKDGADQTLKEAGQNLAQAVNTGIGAACEEAIGGRYPFVKSSSRDVT